MLNCQAQEGEQDSADPAAFLGLNCLLAALPHPLHLLLILLPPSLSDRSLPPPSICWCPGLVSWLVKTFVNNFPVAWLEWCWLGAIEEAMAALNSFFFLIKETI